MIEDASQAPQVEVDLLRPEDAPQVAALFRKVYGDGYPVRDYYEPETLIAANRAGRIISSVARTAEGRVVGHVALFSHSPHPKTYESGAGLVEPEHRAGNLFTRMCAHGVAVGGPRFGVQAVWGEPVCNHVYSQRMCRSLGWISMALEVDLMPAAAYAKEKSAEGRVSAVQDFVTLRPQPHRVHLPAAYAGDVAWLYDGFDDRRELVVADDPLPAGVTTRIDNRIIPPAQVARMTLWQTGPDLDQALATAEAEALAQGVEVCQAWLSLGDAWSGAAVEMLRARGYFLGGLLPRWFGVDGLLMQKLRRPPEWEAIKLEFDRAKRLLALVRADWERTV
ncbi:MAG: hypothetical protein ACOZHQ_14385 [Thermodesulfobacteriota bacterium]